MSCLSPFSLSSAIPWNASLAGVHTASPSPLPAVSVRAEPYTIAHTVPPSVTFYFEIDRDLFLKKEIFELEALLAMVPLLKRPETDRATKAMILKGLVPPAWWTT